MQTKFTFTGLFTLLSLFVYSQFQVIGLAPQFANESMFLWKYEDFLSGRLSLLQETTISEDGVFKFNGQTTGITKLVLGTEELKSYIYVQPKGNYKVEFISENPQNQSYNLKEEVELTFFDLDSNDINFKILGFQAWLDNYISDIYFDKDFNPSLFSKKIGILKLALMKDAQTDTSSYFLDFMKYSVASDVDNINFVGAPSEIEKYANYLETNPILYEHDYYMAYFETFYNQYIHRIEPELSNSLFKAFAAGDLTRSDSLLSKDPYASVPELRSLIRIYILKQALNDNFLPRSVILNNLKLISKESAYPIHRTIAQNILAQIPIIQQGGTFLFENINGTNESIDLRTYKGKHIYIHAFNPSNTKAISELSILKKLHATYGSTVEIITLYVDKENLNETEQRALKQVTWKKIGLKRENPIWNNLGILTFPYYILLDGDLNVIASPALTPSPNGKYETIEKTFFDLSKP